MRASPARSAAKNNLRNGPHQSKIKDFCQLLPGEAFIAIARMAWYNTAKQEIATAALQPRNDKEERGSYDEKSVIRLPWQYLPQSYGGVCSAGYGKESRCESQAGDRVGGCQP